MSKKPENKSTNSKADSEAGTMPLDVTADFSAKLDSVVDSMNEVVGGQDDKIDKIQSSVESLAESVKLALEGFTGQYKQSVDAAAMINPDQAGIANAIVNKEGDSEIIIKGQAEMLDTPEGQAKLDLLRFMEEKVRVIVLTTTEDKCLPVIAISVNGVKHYFVRGEEETCSRKYLEGLARAKPICYENKNGKDSEGNDIVTWPTKSGLRYPFDVVEDKNPIGRQWLNGILSQG